MQVLVYWSAPLMSSARKMSEMLVSASPKPPAEVVATYGLASFEDMYRFEDGLGAAAAPKALEDEPAEEALGVPEVLKRGAVAMKTESSGGW